MLNGLLQIRKYECQQCQYEHTKGHQVFATMSSDEFKNGKKTLPFHLKRELNRELKAL